MWFQIQPAAGQNGQGCCLTLGHLLVGWGLPVTRGWGIDDQLEALKPWRGRRDAAVLRADVDAGLHRQAAFTEYLPEFGSIVGGEEDIVPVHLEAAGLCRHQGDEGGERAFVGLDAGDGAGCGGAEAAIGNRGNVAVGEDIAGRDLLPAGQLHAGSAAVSHQDFGHMRVVVEFGAEPGGQRRHLARHLVHAAIDEPDAARFEMGDQHKGGGGLEGIGASVGGVAAIELAQAGIAEIIAQRAPQRRERVDREHFVQVEGGIFQREAQRAHRRAFHEAGFERAEDAGGLGLKAGPALGLGGAGELGDGIAAAGVIGPQIKRGAISPSMAGEAIGLHKGEMIVQPRAGIGEQPLEHRAVGEDGGAGIDGITADIDGAQLAAGVGHALDNGDGQAMRRQQHGGAETAHAGSDDDNGVFACQSLIPNHCLWRRGRPWPNPTVKVMIDLWTVTVYMF